MVAEAGAVPGLQYMNTVILYSAGTGTFWVIAPDPVDPILNDPIWLDTGRSPASLGIAMNNWFTLTIHHNLDGTFTFKINAMILTDLEGRAVRVEPIQSLDGGVHADLDWLSFHSGDDVGGNGSILYADNIRAWALPCAGDTNDDGQIGFADVNAILSAFNTMAPPTSSPNIAPDSDGDGIADDHVVGFADLNAALGQFNLPCH